MKIVVVGDIHGRDIWKKIIETETFDLIIFLGDYVSSHEDISEEQQIENLKELLSYKEHNPDKVILLRGNHDMQHLGYKWADCSGLFRGVRQWLSKDVHKRKFLKDTQWVYVKDNILFSHAGVSNTWFKKIALRPDHPEDINLLKPCDKFGFSFTSSIFDQTGNTIDQPCTWIRPQALIRDALPKYTQVVGHTPVTSLTDLNKYDHTLHIWLCDTLPFQYLVINDGKFEAKFIGPPTIQLKNRYGYKVWLEYVEGNDWKLKGDKDALTYLGVNYKDSGEIVAVDPSGGPFICVDETLEGKTVTAIKQISGFLITLKDEDKEI